MNAEPHAGLCRYQLADQYGHTQISTSNLAIVPQITYISGQPSGQSSVVSIAEQPLVLSLHPRICTLTDLAQGLHGSLPPGWLAAQRCSLSNVI